MFLDGRSPQSTTQQILGSIRYRVDNHVLCLHCKHPNVDEVYPKREEKDALIDMMSLDYADVIPDEKLLERGRRERNRMRKRIKNRL